jgi:hypothetical protein
MAPLPVEKLVGRLYKARWNACGLTVGKQWISGG